MVPGGCRPCRASFVALEVPAFVGTALVVSWVANGFLMGWLLDPAMPNKIPHKVVARLGYEGDRRGRGSSLTCRRCGSRLLSPSFARRWVTAVGDTR